MKPIIVLCCLIAAALALPAHSQQGKTRMYKCVDGAGKVYYSDKLNPDCDQSSELNRQGMVMKKKEVAKSVQPLPSDPSPSAKNSRQKERRDRALLATYTNEEEIDAARDRSLTIPAQGIKAIESKLEKLNRQSTELKKQADALATQKKPLHAHLLEEVSVNQKEVTGLEAELARRKAQSDLIRVKYESDKQRFRELRGESPQ
ncbi:MAG: DUF4124 domain-containing protein [Prolixibacteraceae bacterium]|nr:DUF4124 domain-containing protein [Burkholderiales bacterium]